MRLPTIEGTIARRILVNYRVDPNILAAQLPAPFRPQVVNGWGMAGICLIRLAGVRPVWWPVALGLGSENAAHRVAVEWTSRGATRSGVYVRRRDTNSRLNTLIGGRLFAGVHHHARFTVNETAETFDVALRSDDGQTAMHVQGERTANLPATSMFSSLDDVSAFFERGSLGYSPAFGKDRFDGLELECRSWQVEPLAVSHVTSSYFDNRELFPAGSIEFDCALLMRQVPHRWLQREDLCCEGSGTLR